MADDADVQAAVFAWEDGARRLDALRGDGLGAVRGRLVDACLDELRRRMGMTFTVAQLVDDYREASGWFLPLAQEVAPKHPDTWDTSVVLDAAYANFSRQAGDAGSIGT